MQNTGSSDGKEGQQQPSSGLPVAKYFDVLEVDEDYVKMSEFVTAKLGTFENGRAFYEFNREEEDLLYYKEVVRMNKVSVYN